MWAMERRVTNRPPRDPTPDRGEPGWDDWIWAHRKRGPGLERHTIPVEMFDPIPPQEPRPELLLKNLVDGAVLPLERVVVQGHPCPRYIVRTESGRDLGRLPGQIAGVVEVVRASGIEIEVSVFAAMWFYPPETALLLVLEAVVCRQVWKRGWVFLGCTVCPFSR